ncbi:hypothetical protein AB6D81_05935 [Vibrio splendidus]
MNNTIEQCYCTACREDTQHVVVLVRKTSAFADKPNQKRSEFWAGMIKGWFLGPFIASMDEFSRHLVCEKCGHKEIQS